MTSAPAFFPTDVDFRHWLERNHGTAPELLVGFWKKSTGKPSIDWPQARDQALCFGWIDGVRKSLGDESYTIRFTPRRKGSIWSKVNVERFEALKAAGLMTAEGERAYEENKHKSGVYAYENVQKELTSDEERQFRKDVAAWADWEGRPASYRKTVLHWITRAKKPETRVRRLTQLIEDSAAGRRLAQYDWQKKP
ncbi:MAG: YdeI/OmpD-associated family protein [Sphingomonas sp.]|uniref:YdeI/OmpD-associated family protein n=1 Tax=Sphingomonas sp. TaxID=28214 RepID=UPI0018311DAA|nr:YdeI/OmpD-associated family protein [Sphingomonas sp.]MBA3667069.1 YdeI/OmpD-associated family protein [Sphingomonas sp.]